MLLTLPTSGDVSTYYVIFLSLRFFFSLKLGVGIKVSTQGACLVGKRDLISNNHFAIIISDYKYLYVIHITNHKNGILSLQCSFVSDWAYLNTISVNSTLGIKLCTDSECQVSDSHTILVQNEG